MSNIFSTYDYLLDAIIALKFPNEMAFKKGQSNDERLAAALESTMVNGGLRRSRSFAKVMIDLRPLMADSKNVGAEELEEMMSRRREHLKAELAKVESEGTTGFRGASHERGGNRGASEGRGGVAFSITGDDGNETKDARGSSALQGGLRRTMSKRGTATAVQAKQLAKTASHVAAVAATTAVHAVVKTKEERQEEAKAAKLTKEAHLMVKHAARVNSKHRTGASSLTAQLKNTNTWMNENTEKINQVVRSQLPRKSIKGIRRFIDSLRLISNFYVAIYICTFIAEYPIAENMTTLTRAGNLVGLVTVIIANTLLDPLVTFEYATIRTMGVINPLLVGETLESVAEIERLEQQVALKILAHWRNVADPAFDEETYVPTKEHLKTVVMRAFDDWDEDKGGSLDEKEFKVALERAGIFFSGSQLKHLFQAIDCFQYTGSIDGEQFWGTFGPMLVRTLEEIQGTVIFEPFTNNIDDTMVSLDDLAVSTKRRRMLRLAKAEAKAEEDALLSNDEEGDPEDKFMRLLAFATKGKLTKEQAALGAKFLQAMKNSTDMNSNSNSSVLPKKQGTRL